MVKPNLENPGNETKKKEKKRWQITMSMYFILYTDDIT